MGISHRLREARENIVWESILAEAFERALKDRKVAPFVHAKVTREAAVTAAKSALAVLRARDALGR
jgi:hypothetical protein